MKSLLGWRGDISDNLILYRLGYRSVGRRLDKRHVGRFIRVLRRKAREFFNQTYKPGVKSDYHDLEVMRLTTVWAIKYQNRHPEHCLVGKVLTLTEKVLVEVLGPKAMTMWPPAPF